ncbi:RDD family protein [Campylobacter sp. RM9344]|uniref:RDD family protein n=1 Tax=Campylobacter californiensis TaxID=1032243 RepID=A0AAW3ZXJ2_9BACT|nr:MULTISPECIES: RDD family protein [unclassified Campylobacter]MBE2984685.1 RDD family protein [Campylobacter sp. RM6883]MBE2994601.1 RDD family protein [Campylobacter sp. RM6913]MBE3021465.1 RDD family protein [Campylobacter sp. 7477a]MBE3029127.1 RDD family protein [Campylobacter sp. RM9344]MBE3608118.1 RDD family protein [Campylobacter sp. RM9337]
MSADTIIQKLERENISLASFARRIYAFCIDEVLISILFMVIYWDKFAQVTTYEETVLLASALVFQMVVLKIIYQTFFTWYYGASIGKIMMKIICIDVDVLDKPNLAASLSRAAMRVFGEMSFYLGFVWAFGNSARQTWHDKLAKTVVVNVA